MLEFKCDPRAGQPGGAVILTNGFLFSFLDGRVCVYRSPWSFYSLQDPDQIPRFFGPVRLSEKEALQIARGTIKKLGYEYSIFNADSPPLVTPPETIGSRYIPRYRFRWLDPNWPVPKGANSMIPALLDIEINGSSGEVEMWITASRETRRPSPKVDVTLVIHPTFMTVPHLSSWRALRHENKIRRTNPNEPLRRKIF